MELIKLGSFSESFTENHIFLNLALKAIQHKKVKYFQNTNFDVIYLSLYAFETCVLFKMKQGDLNITKYHLIIKSLEINKIESIFWLF